MYLRRCTDCVSYPHFVRDPNFTIQAQPADGGVRPSRQLPSQRGAAVSRLPAGLTSLSLQKEAPVCDDVCVKECNPQAAVHQSLFRAVASPHVPDVCAASTMVRPWGGRCELETQEGKEQADSMIVPSQRASPPHTVVQQWEPLSNSIPKWSPQHLWLHLLWTGGLS